MGLKYCGGCNPKYDRTALAQDLHARIGQAIEWVSPEREKVDLVLAIEGCQTACADLDPFRGIETYVITSPQDAERFILALKRV